MKIQVKALATLIGVVVLTSGCSLKKAPLAVQDSFDGGGLYTATVSNPGYNCPSTPNVSPHDGYDYANNPLFDYYSVCRSQSNAEQLVVIGQSSLSSQICVFPVVINTTTTTLTSYNDPTIPLDEATPWTQILSFCGSESTTTGLSMSFGTVAFSSVIITADTDKVQMQQCLYAQNAALCPQQYSIGSVAAQ